jgi:hypothetical protein
MDSDRDAGAPALEIRPMDLSELAVAVDWAAAEGWNPGLADADCFHGTDPEGFLAGFLGGELVASISVVAYGRSFGFLGFYIVKPGYRGRGHGLRIWRAGLDYLGGRTVGLDGVVEQQPNYVKSGFVLANRNVRYGGAPGVAAPEDPGLIDLTELPRAQVLAYDRPCFPAPRKRFLDCWLRPDRRFGLGLVRDGGLAGYGVIRRCRDGFKVGPLFADDEAGADLLFRGLAARAGAAPVFLDPPEPNGPAIALAERYAMTPVFETARMYRGPAPALPLERIFGITTFELG